MAVSLAFRFLWIIGTSFLTLPHLNVGLLSDFKICGDSACESLMSRVQAIRDHHGKDCRFLSFRRGDTIFVYYKLTGKREDLWAGSIDKQFGYFPKDAVQEEQVYAAMEQVVETQESDFFCMDEFGYPIDSSHLDDDDRDDNDDDESNQKIQIQESETTLHTHHNNAERLMTSADHSTESPVSAQKAEGDENKNVNEEAGKILGTMNEQGESPSSAWLGSSITGWLGLDKEEQPGYSAEGGMENDTKEAQAETLLASSVSGWLGFGGDGKPEDTKESVESKEETPDSVTSTMSRWLSFEGEKKTEYADEEKDETVEKFRSRRMSLDLESSQLHEEEKKDVGTLSWLGNGLSSTLGFGLTSQETGHETSGGEAEEEKEPLASSSWLNTGIGDIWGFRKDTTGVGENAGKGLQETERDMSQTGSQNVDISQSQLALTENVKTETAISESQTEDPPKGENAPSSLSLHIGYKVGKEEELEYDNKEENKMDEPRSAEIEGEDHQMPKSVEDEGKDSNMKPGEQEVKTQNSIDQEFVKQSNHGSVDLMSNSMGQSVGEIEEDDEKDPLSVKAGDDDHEEEASTEKVELPHREILTTHTEESAEESEVSNEKSQLFFSSDEKNEPIPAENGHFTPHRAEAKDDSSDTKAMTYYNAEPETGHSEGGQEEETHPIEDSSQEFGLLHSTGISTESQLQSEDKEKSGTTSSNGSATNTKSTIGSETENEGVEEPKDVEKQEMTGVEENEKVEDLKEAEEKNEDETQEMVEELEDDEKQQEANEVKEEGEQDKLKEVEEIKGEEKQQRVNGRREEKEEEDMEDMKEKDEYKEEEDEKAEDSKEEKEEKDELKGEEEGNEMGEIKQEKKQREMEALQEEDTQVDGREEDKEGKENQVQSSYLEVQMEKIQDDIHRPEPESNERELQDEDGLGSFVKTDTITESPWVEGEKAQDEEKIQEEVEEVKDEKMEEERVEEKDVEDDSINCPHGLCSEGSQEALVVEGDMDGSEDGGSLKGEEMTGKQSDHTDGSGEWTTIQSDESKASGEAGTPQELYTGVAERQKEDSDIQVRENEDSGSWSEGRQELSVSASENEQAASPGSSLPPDDHSRGMAERETGGAFGLFKNTFSFFSQAPATEPKDTTQPDASFIINPDVTSRPQASLTPEQELDSTTDSSQNQDVQPDSLTEQSFPPMAESNLHAPPPNPEVALQSKALSRHYKNLLNHVSADETTLLLELFGRHKLQFLEYILSGSEANDPDGDQSLVSDIDRLLHHHMKMLVAPSLRLTDAPQEDKEKTRTLIALQKLEILLERVRKTVSTGQSDVIDYQAEASCVGPLCLTHSKDKETENSGAQENSVHRDGWMAVEQNNEEERGTKGGDEKRASPPSIQPGSPQLLEGVTNHILDLVHQMAEESIAHTHAVGGLLMWLTVQVVSALPDDIRPGPDLYGMPWEPIIITSVVGLVTVLLFTCRCYSSIKSRMYRSKERWMAEQVAQLLEEKCKVLETLSQCQQEYDDLEGSLRDSGVLAQTQKTEQLEVKARHLEHCKRELEMDLDQLKDQLDQQREHRIKQEKRIAVLEESMKTFEEETKDLQSQDEQAQTTLKVYSMNSDRLQRNLETASEENRVLQESNAQLRQQVEGWAERVSELEAEMRRCEVAHSGMLQDVANKDERITSLTDRLLRMKAWDSDLEEEKCQEGERETTNGTSGKGDAPDERAHLQKVQKLIYAAKLNADLKSADEDKDRVFAKLNDEVKAKEDLQVSIKELENEKLSLQSDAENYSDQVQRLQQKLQIMTEMYQENELKLHRLLTVEEKERLQKEEKLNKADKNIAMAMEELNNYRQRAEEMEDELEKSKQSYQTQISAHEKKAHNNWLAARAAERELSDIRRENALLRQKLTDTQFKMDALDKDPYALDSLARPLPFRAERSPYGPSPLGRPASETRPFLSPPTLMDGPPARLSPRVPRGPGEPPGGQGEMERSGGPHSDSGSISPTWERDRRGPPPGPPGPLVPPGYMFPEPGGPMYRRPPPPPGAMGLLPPPGSLPPGPLHLRGFPPGPPHPVDMADGPYRENSLEPGEQEHRESGPSERRRTPEADPRMVGPPPPGPPIGPMDGPFPRRAPYGPPPHRDFYPPRGPGGPPMMPMWAPPPPGMMPPARFPPGGPPHPHMLPYGTPMRPPPSTDGLPPPSMGPPPPQPSLPSPPHNQSPQDNTLSPEDAI